MILVRILNDLIPNPLFYPIWWLLGSWLIWLFIKLTPWPRPTLPIMLIYSVSVLIEFVKSFRELEACFIIEICAPFFSLLWFLVDVSFWFIILYALMKWISRIKSVESYKAEL
jgi:hypothetical protein